MKVHPIVLLIASPAITVASSLALERKRKDVTLDSTGDSTVNRLQEQALRESLLLKEALHEQKYQSTENKALKEALEEQRSAAATRSLQDEDTTESGSPTYYPTFYILSPEEIYGDSWWADLPKDIQRAFKVLGWDQVSWDTGVPPPSENMLWDELTLAMQSAARVIGYTQETWDQEEDVTDSIEYYAWISLPEYAKDAAIILGWNEYLWDNGGTAWSDEMLWNELSSDAQEAAMVLGYDEASWNAGVPAKDEEEDAVSTGESVAETTTPTISPSIIISTVAPSMGPDSTESPVINDEEVTTTVTTVASNDDEVTSTEATMAKSDDKFIQEETITVTTVASNDDEVTSTEATTAKSDDKVINEENDNATGDDKFVNDETTVFTAEQSMSMPQLDMSMVESYNEASISMSMSMKVTDNDLSPIETVSNDKIFVDSTIDDDAVDDHQVSMSMSMSIPEDVSALNKEKTDDSR